MPRPARPLLLLVLLGALASHGCGDSPSDVVENLGEYAKKHKLVQFRKSFSTKAQASLKRQFREDGLTEAEGWRDLMVGYLGPDKEPPEVMDETTEGDDHAFVKVSKTLKDKRSKKPGVTIIQTLELVKEKGQWRLALGRMRYEVVENGKKKKKEEEKPLTEEEEDFAFGDDKKADDQVEDIDLDDF